MKQYHCALLKEWTMTLCECQEEWHFQVFPIKYYRARDTDWAPTMLIWLTRVLDLQFCCDPKVTGEEWVELQPCCPSAPRPEPKRQWTILRDCKGDKGKGELETGRSGPVVVWSRIAECKLNWCLIGKPCLGAGELFCEWEQSYRVKADHKQWVASW